MIVPSPLKLGLNFPQLHASENKNKFWKIYFQVLCVSVMGEHYSFLANDQ
jgi:hypothetical protein